MGWILMVTAVLASQDAGGLVISTPEAEGLSAAGVASAMEYAFARTGDDKDRLGIRSDGIVVLRHGRLVAERYARGYDADRPHLSWSVTKSVTATLVGIAVAEGRIDVQNPAYTYYPGLARPETRGITVDQLLQMSSGLYWNEGYESSPVHSRVLQMLYTRGRGDMAAFTAGQALLSPPGSLWSYSSGTSNLLMGVLRGAVGEAEFSSWPWTRLFDPLGMENVTFERDGSGTFVGSSYWYATARDQARFGQFALQDGVWSGRRLLPEGWMAKVTAPNPAWLTMPATPGFDAENPGSHWWTNTGNPARGIAAPWPEAPPDTYAAIGHWGQYILVIPSLAMVVARTGDDRNHDFSVGAILERLLAGTGVARQAPPATPFAEPMTKTPKSPSNKGDLKAFPSIISAYYAKELCSCLWVVGLPEPDCHDWVTQYIPIKEARVNEASQRVTILGLGRVSQARYVGSREGCTLEPER